MGIGTFVSASLDSLQNNRHDVALALACSAVDATSAKTEGQNHSNNKRFKSFLQRNMKIVTFFGFPGIIAGGIKIKCINVPGLKTDQENMVGIEDIIYHIIRCGLIHQCEINERIEFTNYTYIGDFENKFKIPSDLVFGLLMSVILCEENINESLDKKYSFSIAGKNQDLNSLWGKKKELLKKNITISWRGMRNS